jgi:rhamnopyranosyl-N-acetylglucosaminyl-diphospho-decaprenol beta-1,3/1,4-galactofuranosyltransferase
LSGPTDLESHVGDPTREQQPKAADLPADVNGRRLKFVAVVVTRDRPRDLSRLLGKLEAQTPALHRTVVVDNGMLPATREVLSGHPSAIYLPSHRNLGGAGGFCLGILHALAEGADRIWIMDDDGYPEASSCLADLAAVLEAGNYDMASPLILDIEDTSRLAFFYYRGGRRLSLRSQVGHENFQQFAHLFNGALIRAEAFERFGLPRYELFFRGDEVDFMYRLKRGGARFVTVVDTAFLHPSGKSDTLSIMQGRYHAVIPSRTSTRYYYYRNRGNLFREFKLFRAFVYDFVRYFWAFVITKRGDLDGLRFWLKTTLAGWSRSFEPYSADPPAAPAEREPVADRTGSIRYDRSR